MSEMEEWNNCSFQSQTAHGSVQSLPTGGTIEWLDPKGLAM